MRVAREIASALRFKVLGITQKANTNRIACNARTEKK